MSVSRMELVAGVFGLLLAVGMASGIGLRSLQAEEAGPTVEVEAEAKAKAGGEATTRAPGDEEAAKGGCRSFARATATARVDSSGRTVTRHAEEQAEDIADGCRAVSRSSATVRTGN